MHERSDSYTPETVLHFPVFGAQKGSDHLVVDQVVAGLDVRPPETSGLVPLGFLSPNALIPPLFGQNALFLLLDMAPYLLLGISRFRLGVVPLLAVLSERV